MKYKLICYVFNKIDNTYVNDYIDLIDSDEELIEKFNTCKIPLDFKYPSHQSITKIIGELSPSRRIEIYIIKF